jgi:histidinol-phosphate aminotransferase
MPLVPEYIQNLKPYVPGKSIDFIQKIYGLKKIYKLASNENPLGPSPKAVDAMIKAIAGTNRYPDIGATVLRKKLAKRYNLKMENVAVGNGSEGIMANILRCFLCDNDEMISSESTFIGFRVLAKGRGNEYIEVPMSKETYKFDLNGIADRINVNTKIIYLCNPNNPTGTIYTKKEFDEFIKRIPEKILVIIDEAYYEYAQNSDEYPDSLIYRYDNVITLRTFSKIYGIAGARIGYGFAHEELIHNIMKVKLPFEPGNLAQAGAIAALDDDEFVNKSLDVHNNGYEYLTGEFDKMDLKWIPSYSNFVMVDFGAEEEVNILNEILLKEGIIIRPLKPFGLPNCVRITIGLEEENFAFIHALKKFIQYVK